jgi:nucleotide-binding universal stress UspA family protein
MATIQRILAAVDLSSCSRAALEFACSLARTCNASVEVLFVHGSTEGGAFNEPAVSNQELHAFVKSVAATTSVPLSERVEGGDARERIVAVAQESGFDVIVLGTHGRTGRARSLAGSVAECVVRTASCPVITVREPQ